MHWRKSMAYLRSNNAIISIWFKSLSTRSAMAGVENSVLALNSSKPIKFSLAHRGGRRILPLKCSFPHFSNTRGLIRFCLSILIPSLRYHHLHLFLCFRNGIGLNIISSTLSFFLSFPFFAPLLCLLPPSSSCPFIAGIAATSSPDLPSRLPVC